MKWEPRGKDKKYRRETVELRDIEPPPEDQLNPAEMKRLADKLNKAAAEGIDVEPDKALVLWRHKGKLIILEGAERYYFYLALGCTKGNAFVLDCDLDTAIQLAREFRKKKS